MGARVMLGNMQINSLNNLMRLAGRLSGLAALAGASLIALASPSFAQSEAIETTAYKDWVVRCVQRDTLPPCDAVQSLTNRETNQTIMISSVAYLGNSDQIGVQIFLPSGILVSGGVLFEIDGETRALENLQFTRCEANGCFIEAITTEEGLAPLKKGTQAAVAVLNSNGEPRVNGLSLSGFTAAFKEVQQKNAAWYAQQ